MRIGVQPLQLVAMPSQRIEKTRLLEELRRIEVLLLAGESVEVRQHLVHAAVLGAQHALALLIADAIEVPADPASDAFGNLQGLLVAGVDVYIDQSSHDLVQRVEGCPHRTARPIAIALGQGLELGLGIGAQIAVSVGLLAARQLGHHRVATGAQRCRCPRSRTSAQLQRDSARH